MTKRTTLLYLLCALLGICTLFGCSSKTKTYQEACEENDYVTAHQRLDELRSAFVDDMRYFNGVENSTSYQEYISADNHIFNAELLYLLQYDDPTADNRILSLVTETPLDGSKPMKGINSYFLDDRILLYIDCVKRFNKKCDLVLDNAVICGRQSLASKVLALYKENILVFKGSSYIGKGDITIDGETIHVDGDHSFVYYTLDDLDSARKRYEQAVNVGAFK